MDRKLYVLIGIVVFALGLALPASALQVQSGVAQYSYGARVDFPSAFSQTPVIVTSAQKNGKAVSSCAVSNSATGFTLYLHDDNRQQVQNAWVQWIAFVPDAGAKVQGAVVQAGDGQRISFPTMSGVPVIVTSAQKDGYAVNACAVSNVNNGFTLALKDQNNNAVQSAWLQWMAVIPTAQNGFKGDVADRNSGANVTCAAFASGPAYVVSAQRNNEPMAAAAVNNRNDGFSLSVVKHDGSSGGGWTQWVGCPATPTPALYAIICGGENTGNPYYDWYWGATSGMYDVLKNRYGYTDANIYFYFCDTHSNNSRVDGVSTKANVQAALNTLKTKMKPGDRLFCYFVGHGTYVGGVSTYNTVGADMTDAELNTWRQGLPANQTYVFTQCYSGHFCNALAAPNTVVITSCTSGETNWKAFAEPIRDAFNMVAGADANNDGKVSVGEAYNYTLNNVKQQYGTIAMTEHCQMEDNGDGTSSYCVLPCSSHGTLALRRFLK